MKKLLLGLMLGVIVGFGAAALMRTSTATASKPTEAAKSTEAPKDNPLHLPAAKRAAAGITLATPERVSRTPSVEAFGRALDPTPYVALVAEQATAKAAADASRQELARVQKLFAAGGNASAQAVEAADAAAARDRAALASAHLRLLAAWGERLANLADLTTLSDVFAKGATLVRLDLVPGAAAAPDTKTAEVALVGSDDHYEAEVLGPAPVADPQIQGLSFLGLIREHSLPAGAALRVSLPRAGPATDVLTVPRGAIVYHQGSAWVYVLGKDDTFRRALVAVDGADGDRVIVTSGVDAADQVAVAGAQQLLSTELQAGGAEDAD